MEGKASQAEKEHARRQSGLKRWLTSAVTSAVDGGVLGEELRLEEVGLDQEGSRMAGLWWAFLLWAGVQGAGRVSAPPVQEVRAPPGTRNSGSSFLRPLQQGRSWPLGPLHHNPVPSNPAPAPPPDDSPSVIRVSGQPGSLRPSSRHGRSCSI